jgi:hypothetical protein
VKTTPQAVFRKLAALYERMGRAYETSAQSIGLSCAGCPDNCCTSFFQHHTYVEWAYLWKGLAATAAFGGDKPDWSLAVPELGDDTGDLDAIIGRVAQHDAPEAAFTPANPDLDATVSSIEALAGNLLEVTAGRGARRERRRREAHILSEYADDRLREPDAAPADRDAELRAVVHFNLPEVAPFAPEVEVNVLSGPQRLAEVDRFRIPVQIDEPHGLHAHLAA